MIERDCTITYWRYNKRESLMMCLPHRGNFYELLHQVPLNLNLEERSQPLLSDSHILHPPLLLCARQSFALDVLSGLTRHISVCLQTGAYSSVMSNGV